MQLLPNLFLAEQRPAFGLHRFNQRPESIRIDTRVNAVPQIKYMTWMRAELLYRALGFGTHRGARGIQHHRIDIALQCHPRTDAVTRIGERRRPIQADAIGTGIRLLFQRMPAAFAENDQGYARGTTATLE